MAQETRLEEGKKEEAAATGGTADHTPGQFVVVAMVLRSHIRVKIRWGFRALPLFCESMMWHVPSVSHCGHLGNVEIIGHFNKIF
jgi:hypothetical protein